MKFRSILTFDREVERWSVFFPEFPTCFAYGDTEEEAIASATKALALWFEPPLAKLARGAKMLELPSHPLEEDWAETTRPAGRRFRKQQRRRV
jgi:predicted RNase H-like HicB family nuclease